MYPLVRPVETEASVFDASICRLFGVFTEGKTLSAEYIWSLLSVLEFLWFTKKLNTHQAK